MKCLALALLCLLFLFTGCDSSSTGNVVFQEPITIGFIGPLTGDLSVFGVPQMNAVKMARDLVNANGGINGRQIEVIFEDTKTDPKETVTVVHKLIDEDRVVAIVGPLSSSPTMAVAPIVENEKIPLISPVATSPVVRFAGDYIFRTMPSIRLQTQKLAEFIKQEKNISSVGVIYVNNDFGLGALEDFKNFYSKIGGSVTVAEAHDTGAKDFRTQIAKMQGVKAIVLASYPRETGLLLKQIRELAVDLPIFGIETVGHKEVIDFAGSSAEGVIYAYPKVITQRDFVKDFQEEFGIAPAFGTDAAYDALMLIVEAARKCGIDGEDIKNCLYLVGQNYEGISGNITFDAFGDVNKPVELFEIKDSKNVVVG